MIFKNQTLETKLRIIISLFIAIILCGIAIFVKNLTAGIIYQQIALISMIVVIWTICILVILRYFRKNIVNPLKKAARISMMASVGSLSEKIGYNDES